MLSLEATGHLGRDSPWGTGRGRAGDGNVMQQVAEQETMERGREITPLVPFHGEIPSLL